MIITLKDCLECAFFHYCHETWFKDRPCKKPSYYKNQPEWRERKR